MARKSRDVTGAAGMPAATFTRSEICRLAVFSMLARQK
jgi:hypothetical protein